MVKASAIAVTEEGIEIDPHAVPGSSWLEAIEHQAEAVGRLVDARTGEFFGTAFLVGDDVALTMRHVADAALVKAGGATSDLRFELGSAGQRTSIPVKAILPFARNQQDMVTALQLAEPAPAMPLSVSLQAPYIGQKVAVLGYPMPDPRVPEKELREVFGSRMGEKFVITGAVTDVSSDGAMFTYDCFTSGGTGGGCVLDLETKEVVGVHFAGKWEGDRKVGTARVLVQLWQHRDDGAVVGDYTTVAVGGPEYEEEDQEGD